MEKKLIELNLRILKSGSVALTEVNDYLDLLIQLEAQLIEEEEKEGDIQDESFNTDNA